MLGGQRRFFILLLLLLFRNSVSFAITLHRIIRRSIVILLFHKPNYRCGSGDGGDSYDDGGGGGGVDGSTRAYHNKLFHKTIYLTIVLSN